MNKIIFLDIDGPIIPIDVSEIESICRTTYSSKSIKYLNKLCKKTGAKIVTNSMHNYQDLFDSDLRDDLISWGLDKKFIHDDWRTIFPMIDYKKVKSPVRGIGRLVAILDWIKCHGETIWVCFDDRKFSDLPNLVYIEDGMGIEKYHFDSAMSILANS